MSFPASPTNGQTVVLNNITYSYSSSINAWVRVATSPTETIAIGSSLVPANSLIVYNTNIANWIGSGSYNYFTVSTGGWSYMPQNYWIGPGDSIALAQYNMYSYSATVGYHFTTITES